MEEKVFHLNFNYTDKLSSYFILVNLFVLKSLKLDWLPWIFLLTALHSHIQTCLEYLAMAKDYHYIDDTALVENFF